MEVSVPLVCVHAISLVLNGALCGTLLRRSLFRCPSNRFVLSLTISHILVSLLTVGVSMAALVHVSVHDLMEEISLYMTYGSGLVNSLTLTTISCERYITIARPMRYKSIVTSHRCSLVIIFLWALSALITLFPLLVIETSSVPPNKFVDFSYFPIVFTIVTLLCLLVMSICYYIIFKIAKEKCQHVQIGQFTASISSDWPSSAYPSQAHAQGCSEGRHTNAASHPSSLLQHVLKANARHINSVRAMELERVRQRRPQSNSPRKTISTIIALVGNLILTQLPVAFTLINEKFWNVAMIMLALSAVTNPILYGFLNRKIRSHLWKTLRIRTKPKRPDCCKYQQQSIYSDSIIVQNNHVHEDEEYEDKREQICMDKDGIIHSDKLPLETNVHDGELGTVVPPESMQFPRKDSQDSGADMTFSDEEEDPTIINSNREPNVFTICNNNNNDDQSHQAS